MAQEEKSRYPSIEKIIGDYEETDKKKIAKNLKNGFDKNGKKVAPKADDGGVIKNRSTFKLQVKTKEKDKIVEDEEAQPRRKKSRSRKSKKKP